MICDPREIEYRMQPSSKVEDGKVKLLPLSQQEAQEVLTDIVQYELGHCRTIADAREIESKLYLIAKNTDVDTVRYMGQVQATIKRIEGKF
jgi:hypothetical protein